jgi:hypothetical protein
VHTLASWFASDANIQADTARGTARGSTGKETGIRVALQTSLTLENGQPLPLAEAIVVDLPPMFEQLRIAGLLSPQLLAKGDDAAVLDLRVASLRIEPFRDAVDRLNIKPLRTGRVCVNQASEFRNRAYSMTVTVHGHRAAVILDSGATRSVIAADSATASALAPRSVEGNHTQGVGGEVETYRHVPDVIVKRAGIPAAVDLILGKSPGPDCGPDGLLGMDALRQCLLVLGSSALAITCSR